MLLLQKPRTRQPLEDGRVDWGAPVCRGLVAVQHYAAANYQAFNGDVFPIEVGADVRRTPQGGLICLRHPSWFTFTGSISIPRVNGYVGSTTVLSVFIPGTNAAASNVACLGGSAGHLVVSTVSGTTTTITATFRGVAGTVGGTDTSLPYLAPYTTVARNIQAAEQSLWINGKKDPATLAGTATAFNAATIGHIASCRSGLALNAYFLRALSDSEIVSLSENPWQLFEPRLTWIPVSVAGGTSYNVSLSESGSSGDSYSTALSALAAVSESATASDAATVTAAIVAAISEAGSADDALSSLLSAAADLSESLSAADSITVAAVYPADVSESGSASEVANWGGASYAVELAETATLTDAVSVALQALTAMAEAGSAADTYTVALYATATLSEVAAAVDSISATNPQTYAVSLSEAATVIETITVTLTPGGVVVLSAPPVGRRTQQSGQRINIQAGRRPSHRGGTR